MEWKCIKCGNSEFENDQFQATGGNFAKIFDVQNKVCQNSAEYVQTFTSITALKTYVKDTIY